MRRTVALVSLAALIAALPAAAEKHVTRSARLTGGDNAMVTVVSPAGSVTVTATADDEVRVDATFAVAAQDVEVAPADDGSSVTVTLTGARPGGAGSAHLEVAVPAACSIRVYGGAGLVEVEGGAGTRIIDISTREADVRITGTAMAAVASAFAGNVVVDGRFAAVTARTATGSVTVKGNLVEVETDTLGGLTQITARGLARLAAQSVSGDILLRCAFREPAPLNSLSAESSTGSIRLWVPEGLRASYEVSAPDALAPESMQVVATVARPVTVQGTGMMVVGGTATDSGTGSQVARFNTGSDRTRITLTTRLGIIAIQPGRGEL